MQKPLTGFLWASEAIQQKAPPVRAGLASAKAQGRLARHPLITAPNAPCAGAKLDLPSVARLDDVRLAVAGDVRHSGHHAARHKVGSGITCVDVLPLNGRGEVAGHRAISSISAGHCLACHSYTHIAHIMQAAFRAQAADFSRATARPFPATRLHPRGFAQRRAPIGARCPLGGLAHRQGRAATSAARPGIREDGWGSWVAFLWLSHCKAGSVGQCPAASQEAGAGIGIPHREASAQIGPRLRRSVDQSAVGERRSCERLHMRPPVICGADRHSAVRVADEIREQRARASADLTFAALASVDDGASRRSGEGVELCVVDGEHLGRILASLAGRDCLGRDRYTHVAHIMQAQNAHIREKIV